MNLRMISLMGVIVIAITSACSPAQTPIPVSPTSIPSQTPAPTDIPTLTPTPAIVWDYVALGDSNPRGYGVGGRSYVPIYAEYIAKDLGIQVQVHNWAFDGATSDQLLKKLRTDPDLQRDVREAEVVTIDIGANDWGRAANTYPYQKCGGADNQDCLRELMQAYSQNFDAILDEIVNLEKDNTKVLIRTVDFYVSDCDFPNIHEDAELFKGIKPYLDEFNTTINQVTLDHKGEVLHLYLAFNGPTGTENPVALLQRDQCHLNSNGHHKVADMLRELGYDK